MDYIRFSGIFDGLEQAYGTYQVERKQNNGKSTGKATVVKKPRTAELWQGHLSGEGQSIGIIPINEDNSCKWGCIDIDQYNFDHKALINKIRQLKLPLVVCRSKSGGAHVFLFTDDWVPAKDMQEVLTHLCAALGYGGSEIFPKQITLNLDRGDVGNFLNTPYYDAEGGLRYAFNDDATAATLDEFFELVDTHVQTHEQMLALTVNEDETLPVPDGPPCLQILCREKIGEGARNNGLFNLGVYLRKAYPDSWEGEILNYNMQYVDPPLPLNEVNIVAKQLQKKDYAYKCKDAPINAYCNPELCRTRKFGIDAAVSGIQIANLRKYNSVPPVWFLDVNGQPLELATDDLMNQAAFQKACVEQLNFLPRTAQKAVWEQRINGLLSDMTDTEGSIVEVSEDVSITGQFVDHLEEFTTGMQRGEDKEDILLRRPWTDEEEEITYFRLKDLEGYLVKANFKVYKSHQLAQRLRDLNGEAKQLRVKGKTIRVWSIPAFAVGETSVKTPQFTNDEEVPF
jgi:hypothetical protein